MTMVLTRLRATVQAFEAQLSAAERTWGEVVALMGERTGEALPAPRVVRPEAKAEASERREVVPARRCVQCGQELPSRVGVSGPPPKYCGAKCRAAAKRKPSPNGSAPTEPVKNWDRPMHAPVEDHSDASALAPPALPWDI